METTQKSRIPFSEYGFFHDDSAVTHRLREAHGGYLVGNDQVGLGF